MKIKELLQKRSNYPLIDKQDSWLEDLLRSNESEVWAIVVSGHLHPSMWRFGLKQVLEKYEVAGIYNLGSPFAGTAIKFELVHLTNEPINSVDIGVFKGKVIESFRKKPSVDMFELPESFTQKYENYLTMLEEWANGGNVPEPDLEGEYEYSTIPREDFICDHLSPQYYSRDALNVRNLLCKEKTFPLSSVADIFASTATLDNTGKVMTTRDLEYPLKKEKIRVKTLERVNREKIKKYDILFPMVSGNEIKPYLVLSDIEDDIYVTWNIAVVRCKDIQPEYLYLYLNSDVSEIIHESLIHGTVFKHFSVTNLNAFPVIQPRESPAVYEEQVSALTQAEKIYNKILAEQRIRLQERQLSIMNHKPVFEDRIEDVLNLEIANKIKLYNEEKVRQFLVSDLKELNDCFNVKAYKATLILAGSILEAVLIDWLSDIKGENYFEKDYMVRDRWSGQLKKAALVDYINEIKYIERPHWMEEANKAHEIRKKRNLVHAKLCMKSDEINEEVCKQVIDYLRDVIKTRGVH